MARDFGGRQGINAGRKGETDKALIRDFGQHVARLRKWRGIAQGDFAERMGVCRASMSNMENGYQNITLTMAYKISLALDLPPSALFSDHVWETDELDQMEHIKLLRARIAELEAKLEQIGQMARKPW